MDVYANTTVEGYLSLESAHGIKPVGGTAPQTGAQMVMLDPTNPAVNWNAEYDTTRTQRNGSLFLKIAIREAWLNFQLGGFEPGSTRTRTSQPEIAIYPFGWRESHGKPTDPFIKKAPSPGDKGVHLRMTKIQIGQPDITRMEDVFANLLKDSVRVFKVPATGRALVTINALFTARGCFTGLTFGIGIGNLKDHPPDTYARLVALSGRNMEPAIFNRTKSEGKTYIGGGYSSTILVSKDNYPLLVPNGEFTVFPVMRTGRVVADNRPDFHNEYVLEDVDYTVTEI